MKTNLLLLIILITTLNSYSQTYQTLNKVKIDTENWIYTKKTRVKNCPHNVTITKEAPNYSR